MQLPDDAVTAVTLNDFGEEEELTDGDLVFNHFAQTELQMSTMRFKCRILPRHAQQLPAIHRIVKLDVGMMFQWDRALRRMRSLWCVPSSLLHDRQSIMYHGGI